MGPQEHDETITNTVQEMLGNCNENMVHMKPALCTIIKGIMEIPPHGEEVSIHCFPTSTLCQSYSTMEQCSLAKLLEWNFHRIIFSF